MPRLVLFDLDNTLIDRDAAFRRWAAAFVTQRALPAEGLDWLIATDHHGDLSRDRFFAAVRGRFGIAGGVDELWARYRYEMPRLVRCPAETLAALSVLRHNGWRIGVVTNGAADNQEDKIQRTALANHVDGWAISGEVGFRKPERAIFEIAARRCGIDLRDVDRRSNGLWMVGDNPVADIGGGRAAGLRTVWLHCGRSWPAGLAPPDRAADDVLSAIGIVHAVDTS